MVFDTNEINLVFIHGLDQKGCPRERSQEGQPSLGPRYTYTHTKPGMEAARCLKMWNFKNKDNLKNEDNLKHEDDIKNDDGLKNEDGRKLIFCRALILEL